MAVVLPKIANAQASYNCGGQPATIVGTSEDDTINGTSGDDVVYSLSGNDTISTGEGNDIICSGGGDDIITSGPGNDLIYSGGGNDTVSTANGDDTVFGQSGIDTIKGQGGNDTLYGGGGDDNIQGGNGDDLIDGQTDNDSISGQGGSDTLRGGNGDDTLIGGSGNDTLYGNSGNDMLFGTNGDNVLIGAHGADQLDGGTWLNDLCYMFTQDTVKFEDDVSVNCENEEDQGENTAITPTPTNTASPTPVGTTEPNTPTPVATPTPVETPTKPRVILYAMLDDADYYDVGFLHEDGITDAVTPNIDTLAGNGVILDNFYSAAPVCSPTRASVISGNNPMRFGMNSVWGDISNPIPDTYQLHGGFGHHGLPTGIQSVADIKTEGYKTAHFGKWHLGNSKVAHRPSNFGFDHYIISKGISPVNESGTPQKVPQFNSEWPLPLRFKMEENGVVENVEDIWRPAYLADEIIEYIDQNKDSGDLFINWWSLVPHKPINVPYNFEQNYDNEQLGFDLNTNRGQLLAMMYDWDFHFGRVVDHLKDLGLYDDSLVMFTSDNGGVGSSVNNPDVAAILLDEARELSGYKGFLTEGGIRVPFAASWPNRIEAGTTSSAVTSTTDILPTLYSIAGKEVPQNIDGIDISQALLDADSAVRSEEDYLYWQTRYAKYARNPTRQDATPGDGELDDSFALRSGCYKILKRPSSTELELYNLCNDIGETINLANSTDPDAISQFNRLSVLLAEQRREMSSYNLLDQDQTDLAGSRILPFDERFNTSDQDLSFYVTIDPQEVIGTQNIMHREGAVELSVEQGANSHLVTANITGVEELVPRDPNVSPRPPAPIATRTLQASIPNDGQPHQIGLVIRGFRVDFNELELYVDGQLQDSLYRENALLSIYSTPSDIELGDQNLNLYDIRHYLTALMPEEL